MRFLSFSPVRAFSEDLLQTAASSLGNGVLAVSPLSYPVLNPLALSCVCNFTPALLRGTRDSLCCPADHATLI